MDKESINIVQLANNDGCFDLQFRKDVRHERTNSPTYYRWKAQFIITAQKEKAKTLSKIKSILKCGNVHISKDQARFSVQKIDDIIDRVIPFFTKNRLLGTKNKDFQLWQKAVGIIYQNKGKYITKWKKHDLINLLEIHKSSLKYKNRPRPPKWMEMAKTFVKNKPSS